MKLKNNCEESKKKIRKLSNCWSKLLMSRSRRRSNKYATSRRPINRSWLLLRLLRAQKHHLMTTLTSWTRICSASRLRLTSWRRQGKALTKEDKTPITLAFRRLAQMETNQIQFKKSTHRKEWSLLMGRSRGQIEWARHLWNLTLLTWTSRL